MGKSEERKVKPRKLEGRVVLPKWVFARRVAERDGPEAANSNAKQRGKLLQEWYRRRLQKIERDEAKPETARKVRRT